MQACGPSFINMQVHAGTWIFAFWVRELKWFLKMERQCKLLKMEAKPIFRKPLPILTLACMCDGHPLSVLCIWSYCNWVEMHQRWVPGRDSSGSSEGTHCIKANLDPDQTQSGAIQYTPGVLLTSPCFKGSHRLQQSPRLLNWSGFLSWQLIMSSCLSIVDLRGSWKLTYCSYLLFKAKL